MNTKAEILKDSGFYIWFDKENKKEYYTTPLTLYKAKINKCKNSNYNYISYAENFLPKISPKKNRANFIKNALTLRPLDLYNPYEERFGMLLIKFLNARLDNFHNAYKDFLYAYGIGLIQINSKGKSNMLLKESYSSTDSFKSTAEYIFNKSQSILIELQKQFIDCVDYMYNLNENNNDINISPYIKFQAFSLKYNMNHYIDNTDVIFNNLSIFKNDFVKIKLTELAQNLNNGNSSLENSVKYSTEYLSNLCYIVLNEIASNNFIIKTCKHCGRYFIPVNRNAEVYCDLDPYNSSEKKCKELGARTTYSKNIQEVEGLLIYRRTYQRRLMEIARNKKATNADKENFNNWKKSAQAKIRQFKSDEITEEELNNWMKKNKDN